MLQDNKFCVYKRVRLDNGNCFYIGKGTKQRSGFFKRNEHHDRVAKKYGYKTIIVQENLSSGDACELEKELIRHYVFDLGYSIDITGYYDKNNPLFLTNQTFGGEGLLGVPKSEEFKQKISNANKGLKRSDEFKKLMSDLKVGKEPWNKGKTGIYSQDTIKKLSDARKSRVPWNKGKKCESLSGSKNPSAKSVICITTGEIFGTMKEASIKYNLKNIAGIQGCCKGRNKSAGKLPDGTKLVWEYYNIEKTRSLIAPFYIGNKYVNTEVNN